MSKKKNILGLAAIRGNRGISLQQIAESTKIGVRALEAIEAGDFAKLPGGIYTTSYIRQYARAIDYPEDDLLDFYRRRMAGQAVSPKPVRSEKNMHGGLRAATPANS